MKKFFLCKLCLIVFGGLFAIGDAIGDQTSRVIWDVTCRVPDVNLLLQIKVTPDDVTVSRNFGPDQSLLRKNSASKLLVVGNHSSLLISQLSVHANDHSTYRMECWNESNPSFVNSFWMTHQWSSEGEISSNKVHMNCKPSKTLETYNLALHVYGDRSSSPKVFKLDGKTPLIERTTNGSALSAEEVRKLQQEVLKRITER
jgi:hypothetical protein